MSKKMDKPSEMYEIKVHDMREYVKWCASGNKNGFRFEEIKNKIIYQISSKSHHVNHG